MQLPALRLVRTAAQAESYAAEVLQSLGFRDARATAAGADSGIDVIGSDVLAQVKMEGGGDRPSRDPGVVRECLPGGTGRDRVLAVWLHASIARLAERAGIASFEFTYDGAVEA